MKTEIEERKETGEKLQFERVGLEVSNRAVTLGFVDARLFESSAFVTGLR